MAGVKQGGRSRPPVWAWAGLALGAVVVLAGGVYGGWRLYRRLTRPPQLTVTLYAQGLNQPTTIANTGVPGDQRLFVTERPGLIRVVLPDGALAPAPFLDLTAEVEDSQYGEQGLLGLAFAPDYAASGDFYVYYSANGNIVRLSHFAVSADPNVADPAETVLLTIKPDAPMHLGGDLAFGPDGYLYLGPGDGTAGEDPGSFAQRLDTLRGKLLRLDVHGAAPYTIPPDNPFVNTPGALPEIWALGLRNPWRFSFDAATGDLYIADVGQAAHEELDRVRAGTSAGLNFGWHCYEGLLVRAFSDCAPGAAFTAPIATFERVEAGAIVGGYVYHGNRYPALRDAYVFADFANSSLWLLRPDAEKPIPYWELGVANPSTFGVDAAGELYIASFSAGQLFSVGAR
ncbi:MAG: PQQ-dependent sugar dehydrogenase [Anaerolineales bacterium]|nr:PQQ-dependent sugar dehydrogenase [Anaerolineales bacterium]